MRNESRLNILLGLGSVAILTVTYSVIVPSKLNGWTPDHMTWLRVVIGPPIAVGTLLVAVIGSRRGWQGLIAICAWTALVLAVTLSC